MSTRVIYISRNCPHSKKLLIGVHKYEFLRPQFQIVDVGTQKYPDYIQSVPTLVVDQNMIKGEDVFGYLNHMVEQIFAQNPALKEKYHPQQGQQGQVMQSHQKVGEPQQLGQTRQLQGVGGGGGGGGGGGPAKVEKGPSHDPVDDLIGWCPDGGCSFADISESNDDCSKQLVSLDNNMFASISEGNDQLAPQSQPNKVPLGQDNSQFQKSEKQQQMDSSYERLMAERQLIK
jgi:hypothetical protein